MSKKLIFGIGATLFFSSLSFADCWKFTDKGIDGIAVDYAHAADRLCWKDYPGVPYQRILVKLYHEGETISNLVLVNEGSKGWYVTEERTQEGSFIIPDNQVFFRFPFFSGDSFQLSSGDDIREYKAEKE
jgi:hypothetical protein